MKLNETHHHYIGLFTTFGVMLLFIFGGAYLGQNTEWGKEIWASSINRVIIIFVLPVLTLWFGLHVYSYFFGKLKFIRTFKATERKSLVDCKDGELIRLQGALRALNQPLHAPLSNKACFAYQTRAQREEVVSTGSQYASDAQKTIWETIKVITQHQDFLIQCSDMWAVIRTQDSLLKIHSEFVRDESNYEKDRGGFLSKNENETRKAILQHLDIPSRNFTGVYAENIRFEEGILEPDELVAIKGQGRWVKTADAPDLKVLSEQGIDTVYEVKSTNEHELIISDDPQLLEQ